MLQTVSTKQSAERTSVFGLINALRAIRQRDAGDAAGLCVWLFHFGLLSGALAHGRRYPLAGQWERGGHERGTGPRPDRFFPDRIGRLFPRPVPALAAAGFPP